MTVIYLVYDSEGDQFRLAADRIAPENNGSALCQLCCQI